MTNVLFALCYMHVVYFYIYLYMLCCMCNYNYFHIFGSMEYEN